MTERSGGATLARTVLLLPLGLARGDHQRAGALPLVGGPMAFTHCEVTVRQGKAEIARAILPTDELLAWATLQCPLEKDTIAALLRNLTQPRAAFADLDLGRPKIMGIINVTPDSFSDGGDRYDGGVAIEAGLAMLEAGADILDIGGESTRPGAAPVSVEEELRRVLPVVRGLAERGAAVSIDTRRAMVMREAAAAGASIINDVTALSYDPDSLSVAAELALPVILMHIQGKPETMQKDPRYDDVTAEVFDYLCQRVAACEAAGISKDKIAVDPGIGFGKTVGHNLTLLDRLAAFHGTGCAVLLGASRKRFIGGLSRDEAPKDRLAGSLACALAGVERAVQMVRVHDVAQTRQALTLQQAIASAPSS
ncbi:MULTISPECIES: dihydropteroate synthase [Limibacillus]|uniref:Dihydropteroate synthase n=1 Tax=Limibacillus halophilus TaxID=1579333 RepID=A0A839SPG2_9PROT|nr:dihydropteroate synthase [Limibacillus halophilus]MBB3064787.1 dihydropteroate synthase [Limibacillus halophilus]